jgi:hypothetical protein
MRARRPSLLRLDRALIAIIAALLVGSGAAYGRSSSHSGTHSHSHSHTSSGTHSHHRAVGVPRDSHGKIKRSAKAKDEFRKNHPCPSTGKTSGRCPGYVIDHVQALKHGGSDSPGNMQWQTTEAAKE